MKTMYFTPSNGTIEITPVKLSRVTNHHVITESGEKQKKVSQWGRYHETYPEAVRHLYTETSDRLNSLDLQLVVEAEKLQRIWELEEH